MLDPFVDLFLENMQLKKAVGDELISSKNIRDKAYDVFKKALTSSDTQGNYIIFYNNLRTSMRVVDDVLNSLKYDNFTDMLMQSGLGKRSVDRFVGDLYGKNLFSANKIYRARGKVR